MAGLRFLFSELVRETRTLQNIAQRFLDPSTLWVLEQFRSQLESIWGAQEMQVRLALSPLRTRPNSGAHEAGGRRGRPSVYAVISGTWDLTPLGPSKHRAKRELAFTGIASTKVELYEHNDSNNRLAMWRLELGADDAPGCYFHVQILGDSGHPPFPRSIPIPRLPSLFVTPMSSIEYVLGEMFQEEWAQEAARGTAESLRWRVLQQQRLSGLLSWYQSKMQGSLSSPWMNIKTAKPDEAMFTQN